MRRKRYISEGTVVTPLPRKKDRRCRKKKEAAFRPEGKKTTGREQGGRRGTRLGWLVQKEASWGKGEAR